MSDLFQPGQHPDAEQLSSFAENALPAHERESVLVHLAGCAACREIVALSQPHVEEVVALLPAEPRRARLAEWLFGWFSGWHLAWPVAGAALAAGLIAAVILHNPAQRQATSPATQMAANAPLPAPTVAADQMAAPVAAPKAPQAMAAKPLPPPQAAPVPSAGIAGAIGAAPAAGMGAAGAVISNQQIQALPLEGRSYTALQPSAGGQFIARAADGKLPQPLPVAPAISAAAPSYAAKTAEAYVAAAAPPAPAKPTETMMDAVVVDGAAVGVETTNAIALAQLTPAKTLKINALPSHLAVASSVTRDANMLALDTAGALFLSKDSGRRWMPVATPWRGRTILLTPASLTRSTVPALKLPPSPPEANATRLRANATGISLSGTVTDPSGATIPGATVTLTVTLTTGAATNTAKTDSAGRYAFTNLPTGSYQLRVESPGFTTYQSSVALAAGQPTVQNIELNLGSVSETVTVEADSSRLATGSVAKRKRAEKKSAITPDPRPAFAITTDAGERWTSADGLTWARLP